MVEVEKYIKRLLYDQDCVIIPDFGGVLTHYLPARFDSFSGRYVPSERKVAFNEVLKIDDGLLAKFISENEGMPYEQAQRHIRDFVQTAQSLIRKNKVITLNGIGTFRLNEEGRMIFQPDEARNFHAEFYGLQPVGAADLKANPVVTAGEEVGDSGETGKEFPATGRKIAWGNWISAASIACILVYVSAVFSQEPGATSSLNPVETIRTLFNRPDVDKMAEPAPEVYTAEPVADTAGEEETAAVEEEAPAPVTVAENRFHIIASVYESKSSLEKYGAQMADQLRSHGYETIATLTVKDKYMLSAGAFATWNEAQKAIPALSKTARGAWIYKKK